MKKHIVMGRSGHLISFADSYSVDLYIRRRIYVDYITFIGQVLAIINFVQCKFRLRIQLKCHCSEFDSVKPSYTTWAWCIVWRKVAGSIICSAVCSECTYFLHISIPITLLELTNFDKENIKSGTEGLCLGSSYLAIFHKCTSLFRPTL